MPRIAEHATERMQDARTSLELFLIFLPHVASCRGFSSSLIPSLFCSFPFFSGFTCCSDSSSLSSSSSSCCPSFSAPGSFGALPVEVELGEISAAEAHLDIVPQIYLASRRWWGSQGGSDVWSWRLSLGDLDVPLRLRPAGLAVVGCVSFAVSFACGPADVPSDSLTLGGLFWDVYPSLIVNAAAHTTGLEVGITDDLAALEELSWNSVSLFLDADDTVGSCGLLMFPGRGRLRSPA